MEKILISACLLGKKVRYDGGTLSVVEGIVQQWRSSGQIVSVCPEVDAGMSIPRPPAEITGGDGYGVLTGSAQVFENTGVDVTSYFKAGARIALDLCRKHNIKVAVLTENSPSCGSTAIYDGQFADEKKAGVGVTAALLKNSGIQVFSQHQIEQANSALDILENPKKESR